MFLTRKHLSRRTVLKGTGVAVGLPLLDAMIPAATALADTAAAPQLRVGFFYIPHGAIMWNTAHGPEMDQWTPSGAGESFRLSPILEPLEPFKRYVASFSNLENKAARNSVHTLVPATWLSAVRPDTDASGASMAATIDQIIAGRIGQETPLPSLEVASENTIQAAACSVGRGGCYYSSTLSFRTPTSPLPMEFNPRKVFVRLFGEGDTPEEREAVARQTKSLLDLIADRTKALERKLGAGDRVILGRYLDTVREIERRIEMAERRDLSGIEVPEAPIGELDSFDEQVKLMFDLIALAFQANLTRVASYIMVAEGTNRTYNHIGVPDAFHPLSHHANDLERLRKLVRIQRYHVERFTEFLAKLDSIPDGQGTLLDHSMLLYGSNMSNSDRHNNYPLPTLLVGGGCGTLQGGRHIELPEHTTLANLHLTVLNKVGFELASFADSTGEIAGV
ncbi:MAG TPA: DUF1552 domain-containing protein [Gammaproteobacteria bacterium]